MSTLNVTAHPPLRTTSDGGAATTGVWVGVATISMSFAAYTSALVVRQGAGTDWLHFHLPLVLYANTAVIIASSVALELARRAHGSVVTGDSSNVIQLPRSPRAVQWLGYAILLGLVFLGGQLLAWRQLADQGLFLATNPSSAFFYILTALHGLHLMGGLCGLLYVRRRLTQGASIRAGSAFAAAALYWHFMAVLWIAILALLIVRF